MRPTTDSNRIDFMKMAITQDLEKGFVLAYKQFLKAYSMRDYSTLDQMCEL